LDNPNNSEDDCTADDEFDIAHINCIDDLECPEQQAVSAAPNVPALVWPSWKSKRQAENGILMINAVEMRGNKGRKKK
jgi:hypothetical protein